MRHSFLPFLLVLLTTPLLPTSTWAQDAFEARSHYPADGASAVPVNTSVQVRVRGALFIAPSEGLASALLLVREGGDILAPPAVYGEALEFVDSDVRRAESPSGYRGSTADHGFTLWTAPLELEPDTRYQISSRIAACTEDDTALLCLGDRYQSIATFETGSQRDVRAPVARLNGTPMPASAPCRWELSVTAEDAEAPADAIRYVASFGEGAPVELGPGPVVSTHAPREPPAQRTVSIAAVDPSGNAGPPLAVELPACPDPWEGSDLPPLGDDVELDSPSSSSSCALNVARQSAGAGAMPLGALVLALVLGALRRRVATRLP